MTLWAASYLGEGDEVRLGLWRETVVRVGTVEETGEVVLGLARNGEERSVTVPADQLIEVYE